MRIRILGTAAAEGWPALFCGCDTCRRARAAGGKNARSRASVQIDDVLKIDLPPDTYYHAVRYSLNLADLKHLFFTHSHDDHFSLNQLNYLRPPFAHNLSDPPVRIYGNDAVIGAIESRYEQSDLPIETQRVRPFVPVRADHLTFTPLPAQHMQGQNETPLNYIVQSETATVLYASDTGLYDQATMERLAEYRFDLMIIECTQGKLDMPSRSHMGFDGVLELRDGLIRSGAASRDNRLIVTHFSHNMGMLHEEFEEIARPEGIEVAYDGIEVEI